MTALQIFLLFVQAIGFGAITWWVTDWIMSRDDRAAMKWIREGMVFEDPDGSRWKVVKVAKLYKCVVVDLDSVIWLGKREKASEGLEPIVCRPGYITKKELVK